MGFNPLFIRSVFLFYDVEEYFSEEEECFNPLFIRSVFLFRDNKEEQENGKISFNPLFIRSVFLLSFFIQRILKSVWKFQSLIHQVSVSFEGIQTLKGYEFLMFQSLIHQVSVSFSMRKMLDFVNQYMFQSLIHQVSVSFPRPSNCGSRGHSHVSIPYSSGQCFFSV